MHAFTQAFRRLGSPNAVSWIGVLAVIVQQTAGSFAGPMVDINGRYVEFLLLRWASIVPMVAVLYLGRLVLVRFEGARALPYVTLVTFVLATAANVTSFSGLLILTGFTNVFNAGHRFIVALPGHFMLLIVAALLVTYAREFSSRNRLLAHVASDLLITRERASERIAQRRGELIDAIRAEIKRELSQIDDDNAQSLSTNMKHLIDDIVRPMSYQLNREVDTESIDLVEVPNPKISWRLITARALRLNPVHPIATAAWLGALTGAYFTINFGVMGLLAVIVMIAWLVASLYLIKYCWRFIPESLSSPLRGVLFTSVVLLVMWAPMNVMELISGYRFTQLATTIGWLILTAVMTWSISLIFAVNDQLRETNAALESTVDDLKREVIGLNNQFRLLQKGISRVLHGPIQEAISVAIYRLHNLSDAPQDEDLVADVKKRVDSALLMLESPLESGIQLDTALAELAELWDEVVTIDLSLAREDVQRIQSDSLATYAITELVREACGNAIRHGKATKIYVDVVIDSTDHSVVVWAINNGKPLTSHVTPGLGSQIFEEMTLEWSRRQVGSNVEVKARIPLATR